MGTRKNQAAGAVPVETAIELVCAGLESLNPDEYTVEVQHSYYATHAIVRIWNDGDPKGAEPTYFTIIAAERRR